MAQKRTHRTLLGATAGRPPAAASRVGLQRGMLVAGLVIIGDVPAARPSSLRCIAPYGFAQLRGEDGLFGAQQPPSAEHWFGTTVGGYDVLSRVIWGAQTAFLVIVIAVLLSIFAGVLLGLISGYIGGWLDRVLVVIADAVYAFPSLLLAIVAAIVISGGQSSLLGRRPGGGDLDHGRVHPAVLPRDPSRDDPGEVRGVRRVGAGDRREARRASCSGTCFRNSTRTLPLIFTLNSSEAILTLAGLGFLGFGIQPTSAAEWGYDLNKAIADVTSGIWWTSVFPGSRSFSSCWASPWSVRASTTSPTRVCAPAGGRATTRRRRCGGSDARPIPASRSWRRGRAT